MPVHPYLLAILNDLFDEELDSDLFTEPALDAEPASAGGAAAAADADAPERCLH